MVPLQCHESKGHLFCVENKSFSWLSKTRKKGFEMVCARRPFKMPSDRKTRGFQRKNKLNSISKQTHTALIRSIELIWLSMKLFVLCLPYLPIFRISATSCFCRKTSKLMESSTYPAPFISSIIDSYNLNLISDRSGTIILASLATTPSKLNSIYVSIRWSHGNVPSILIQHMCAFEHILINSLLTPSARENTKSRRK